MNRRYALLLALALLQGCQNLAPHQSAPQAPADEATEEAPAEPVVYGSFKPDTLYSLLVAELAGQRNRFDIALANYVDQAEKTQDSAVSERAYRIAEYLGADEPALDTALLWAKNDPDNLEAQRAAAIQLARAGRYDESMASMEKVLQAKGDTHFDFLALSAAETDQSTRDGLLQSFDRLLNKHPANGQLIFGKALLLNQDGKSEEALELLESHPAQDGEIAPILLRARLLQTLDRGDEALPLLRNAIRDNPEDKRLRLNYARTLVELDRIPEAKAEFVSLVQQYPEDDDLRYSLALVSLENQDWDEAEGYLQELVERDANADAAHLNLGRIREQRNDPQAALREYALVAPGPDYLAAQLRQADILVANGRAREASRLLAEAREAQPDSAIQLYLIESEAYSNNDKTAQADQVLHQAIQRYPDDLNLLYSRAMLAEKRNDLAQMEKDLRAILAREPENAMALNALGYTLADRTTRFDEAKRLIEKALSITPEDPAVLDSLGWVNYRMGNLDDAERALRKAYERLSDPEVAAHLGEVLWANGKRREARQVWNQGLENSSDSTVLRQTIRRLTGSEAL
ncbi:tetratricopeptide repeat protein [Pseudomonas sp. UBA6562]|uniref:tetratricopeptide repeat protein n=1 Tax=Pseudomonas sp. UBA6562 TaxID=1947332 RepID=UPI0025F8AAD4|nr:tetratricopeptide repeat protein [Pseudomonas sp. UBA6562]